MSRELDPKAAAAVIRAQVIDRPNVPPEARHMHVFVIAVCAELGIEPDPINFMTVTSALHDADIKPHQALEYPKMYVVDNKPVKYDNGQYVVFNDADDETEITAWPTDVQEDGSIMVVEPDDAPEPAAPNADEAKRLADEEAHKAKIAEEQKKNDEAKKARRGTAGTAQPDPGVG